MHWSRCSGALAALLVAAPLASAPVGALGLGLEADLALVVKMPLAVADAFDAGMPASDLILLTRSLLDGAVPPADFIEVVTLSPVVYEVARVDLVPNAPVRARRAVAGPGIGVFVQRQLARGLRGPRLARAIHRELHRRGIPAGPPGFRTGVPGPDRVALDLRGLRALQDRRNHWIRDREEGRLEIRGSVRGPGHVPPGQLKKGGGGNGQGVPPGHAKARGRGHARDNGKGHGPPPAARGGQGKGQGHGNGGER
jgi:hypothetical protein